MKDTNVINEKLIDECLKKAKIEKWDYDFGKRLWLSDFSKINKRIEMIGFSNHDHVIDAGSGFGQWTYALSAINKSITCIELDSKRVEFCSILFEKLGIKNVQFINNKIDAKDLQIPQANAIFSYSVLYLTDYKASLKNFTKWLKKDGLLYINSNDIGWYFYNLANDHNSNKNFSSKKMAADVLYNTLNALKQGNFKPGQPYPIARKDVLAQLKSHGFNTISSGADGSANIVDDSILPFFIDKFLDYEAVYEVYSQKS